MDIYPNLTNSLENQKLEQNITETIRNSDVITETIDWFNKVIASTEQIDQIWVNPEISAEVVKIQVLAKKELRALLISKRDSFIADMEMAKDYKEKNNVRE